MWTQVSTAKPTHEIVTEANLPIVQCFTSTVDGKKTLALTALVTVLDVISDLMGTLKHILEASEAVPFLLNAHTYLVVSIPIIVLWRSLLSRSTKFGLLVFLGLSIFMVICAIVRMTGFHYKGVEDDTWEFMWQHIEGAVAVMMASITAFRTLFVKQTNNIENTVPRSPVNSLLRRLHKRFQSLARAQPDEKPTTTGSRPTLKMPKLPSPVFTGMRTFIRRNNHTNVSAATFATLTSVADVPETDYHAALKVQAQEISNPDQSMLSSGTSSWTARRS